MLRRLYVAIQTAYNGGNAQVSFLRKLKRVYLGEVLECAIPWEVDLKLVIKKMKNWIKENWFKLGILIIFFFFLWSAINWMQISIRQMEPPRVFPELPHL